MNNAIGLTSIYLLSLQFGGKPKKNWTTLIHNGVLFAPEYIHHQTPVIYKGANIVLSPEAEEMATIYAKYIDTEYIKTSKFNKNFWHDWKQILKKTTHEENKIEFLADCDFSLIHKYILKKRENVKAVSKEEKEVIKKKRDEEEKKYKTAIVDGKEQPVGNYRMEPPGIFIGRGCHPKLGKIKSRIMPEDIIINISKGVPIPILPSGHKWKQVIHDHSVEWLASWKDTITGKIKYVWLGSHSDLRSKNDQEKFDLARKLKKKVKLIRLENDKNLQSSDLQTKQIATALYLNGGQISASIVGGIVGLTTLTIIELRNRR